MVTDFEELAKDPALTGMLALWLVQPKADYPGGQRLRIDWNFEEMEAHKTEIKEYKLLYINRPLSCLRVAGKAGARLGVAAPMDCCR